jgi:hypothetical protein
MWLALAGKNVWLMVLATSVDTLAGGMGQAAFVAFIMASVQRELQRDAIRAAVGAGRGAARLIGVVAWVVASQGILRGNVRTAMPGLALGARISSLVADV